MNERSTRSRGIGLYQSRPRFRPVCAARALGQMGPRREAIAALIDVISPEKVERALAYWRRRLEQDKRAFALRQLGKTEPPILRRPCPVGPSLCRIFEAVRALGEIGPPAAAAVPALISAFNKSVETDSSLSQIARSL